ncbi:RNA methyltransferase [Verticiella sediminum]|uniref:RNA methyltransferase n=1 Tax=Verticiella sediminum TaxID=1247510 RepID=A0A556AWB8_9BURK|nr:RNA methyltransferase [Verticiella sediminum]TSH96675.1 RNA methyltransferase [Verticiella sediminum]
MVEPSHPGNVGSAARAMKTMGFSRLVLVAPERPDVTRHPDAVALASGAGDVLAAARICATLDEALAQTTLAFGLTARGRDLGPPSCDVREAAVLARAHLDPEAGTEVSMVVGPERAGLTNAHVARCHRICHIPANPAYSSLNVSQAMQVMAWELRYALLDAAQRGVLAPDGRGQAAPTAASGAAVQAFLAHWEEALVAVEFLDPAHPKKLMPRMRHLFSRTGLSQEEVDMLRGVCTAMLATARGRKQG